MNANKITYDEFNTIFIREEGHEWVAIMNVDRKQKTSRILIGFNNNDIFIECHNYDIDLELYGDNHINNKSDIYVYDSTEQFLKSLNEKDLKTIETPFFKYRKIMNDEKVYKEVFLSELFENLKINRPKSLSLVDFDEFNKALYEYGYEKAKRFLYFHLIIFCGEFINEKIGFTGSWTTSMSPFYPFTYVPEFVYPDGTSTKISINHFMGKDLVEASDKKPKRNKKLPFRIENALQFDKDWQKFKQNVDIKQ